MVIHWNNLLVNQNGQRPSLSRALTWRTSPHHVFTLYHFDDRHMTAVTSMTFRWQRRVRSTKRFKRPQFSHQFKEMMNHATTCTFHTWYDSLRGAANAAEGPRAHCRGRYCFAIRSMKSAILVLQSGALETRLYLLSCIATIGPTRKTDRRFWQLYGTKQVLNQWATYCHTVSVN